MLRSLQDHVQANDSGFEESQRSRNRSLGPQIVKHLFGLKFQHQVGGFRLRAEDQFFGLSHIMAGNKRVHCSINTINTR